MVRHAEDLGIDLHSLRIFTGDHCEPAVVHQHIDFVQSDRCKCDIRGFNIWSTFGNSGGCLFGPVNPRCRILIAKPHQFSLSFGRACELAEAQPIPGYTRDYDFRLK